ncbi:MAG: TonB-dependent receptor [Saprospiraceae bacterium]|nr:TonB-dependent receptor [Pyrinomonadaceae bacterium]
MTKNISIKFITLITLSLLLGIGQVFAQSTVSGGIAGKVTDPQGSVIPNATVTVTNIGTNSVVTLTATDDGTYRASNLQPGTYRIETTVSGFAPAKAEPVIVEVGQTTTVDIPLTLGTATAEVEITAEAPVINTSDNSNTTNINQTSINELPINGRRASNFALLAPSTVPDGTFGLISFRGISGLLNNSTVDGGDNNQAFFSEERGRTRINYVISQSSIREFQINGSNYSAEYGRAAGGVINTVTKSGSNEFHGDLFYYNRNNRNGARNPRAFRTELVNGTPTLFAAKPVDLRQQFGGGVGGPIIKDRLFFFFSYDQQKRNFPGLSVYDSPTFLNLPAATRTTLLSRGLTNAQVDSSLAFLRSLSGETARKGDQTIYLPKIDWQINDNNLFSASYNRMRWESPNGVQTSPTVTRGRSSYGDDLVSVDSVNARLQTTFSPNILNEARFQWGRDFERQASTPPLPGEPSTALGGTRSPSIFVQNGLTFGTPNFLDRTSFPDERRIQFADTVTWSHGRHTFKFGGDFNRVTDDIANLFTGAGSYAYNNIGDFILDYSNSLSPLPGGTRCTTPATPPAPPTPDRFAGRCYTSNYQQGIGTVGLKMTTYDYNFFVQDDFRITPRLTVNLGLRYEMISLPDAQLPNTTNTTVIPYDGRTITEATSNIPTDKNNFGPRIGVAYDIFGDGKTSFRGGYGIYYGRIQNSTIYNALINTGNPGGQALVQLAATAAGAPIFPNVLASGTFIPGGINFFAENFQAPLINQYDAILEHQIMKNTVISISYVGSLGRNLPTFYDLNNVKCATLSAPLPTACAGGATRTYSVVGGPFGGQSFNLPIYTRAPGAGTQAMTRIQSTVKSEYNALVLQANRRFTDGLQFQMSYTLSKATDTNQNSATFTQTNSPYDILDGSYDPGPTNFDRRHKFVTSVVWAPNFYKGSTSSFGSYILNGWSLAPIVTLYSGNPYNGTVSGTSLNNSNGDNRFPLLPRNSFKTPSLQNIDVRLSKRFRLTETMNLEFLAEAFNIVNRTHVFSLNNTLYARSGTTSILNYNAAFGEVTGTDSTLYRERQIQFAARFQF